MADFSCLEADSDCSEDSSLISIEVLELGKAFSHRILSRPSISVKTFEASECLSYLSTPFYTSVGSKEQDMSEVTKTVETEGGGDNLADSAHHGSRDLFRTSADLGRKLGWRLC